MDISSQLHISAALTLVKHHQYPSPELIWMISRRIYLKILWPRARAHAAVSPLYHMVSHCDALLRTGTTLPLSVVSYIFTFFVYDHCLEFTTTRQQQVHASILLSWKTYESLFSLQNKECPLFCTVNVGRPNDIYNSS